MKRIAATVIAIALVIGLPFMSADAGAAPAKPRATAPAKPKRVAPAKPKAATPVRYKNCAALTKMYKSGVARPGGVDRALKGGRLVAKKKPARPMISKSIYDMNRHLDADRDGVACER